MVHVVVLVHMHAFYHDNPSSNPTEAYIFIVFLKMGHSRPLFYFRLFYKQLTVNECSIKVADDWIRTRVL